MILFSPRCQGNSLASSQSLWELPQPSRSNGRIRGARSSAVQGQETELRSASSSAMTPRLSGAHMNKMRASQASERRIRQRAVFTLAQLFADCPSYAIKSLASKEKPEKKRRCSAGYGRWEDTLAQRFAMTDEGNSDALGVHIHPVKAGYVIHQCEYAKQFLLRHSRQSEPTMSSLVKKYQRVVGELLFLTMTSAELTFPVGVPTQFCSRATLDHLDQATFIEPRCALNAEAPSAAFKFDDFSCKNCKMQKTKHLKRQNQHFTLFPCE